MRGNPAPRSRLAKSKPSVSTVFWTLLATSVGLVLTLATVAFRQDAFGDLWTYVSGRLPSPPSLASQPSLTSLQKYHEVLERAKALTEKYRNMTEEGSKHEIDQPLRAIQSIATAVEKQPPKTSLRQQDQLPEPLFRAKSSHATSSAYSMKDIVIGMAQDTDPKNLAVFCSSLRKVTTAEIVIFVNSPSPARHTEIAKANDVKLVPFDLSSLSVEMQSFHPSTLRWPLIYRFFQSEETRKLYGRVWMIDVRDAFFQSDPFTMLPKDTSGFYVFQGVESIPIRECGWNSGWIKDCFGYPTLDQVGDGRIICSGVSMGDMNSVFEYLTLMEDVIMARGKSLVARTARFPKCERNGVDQGIFNVLVHKKLIPNLKIFTQSNGPVSNLQAQKARVNNGQVFNQIGDVVPVVHQYDRRPDLQKFLFQKYVYWIDTNDAEAEWKAEEACNSFVPHRDVDLFKGICDLSSKGGATSPASCCAFCAKKPGCRAFTYYSSVCFLKSCSDSGGSSPLAGALSGAPKLL